MLGLFITGTIMTEQTFILGKDAALEDSISKFQQKLTALGFNIEEASWLNPVPNVWSVHIRDKDCPQCFSNGKGASKKAALASALGEYFERLSTNYFFADFYLGQEIANSDFVHYPTEKWFPIEDEALLPLGILDDYLWDYFDPNQELTPELRCLMCVNPIKKPSIFHKVSLRICMCLTECLPVTQKMKHECKGFQKFLNVT